jgi:hypothetical protein
MAESSLTTLVSDEIQGNAHVFVDGEDGFFYGIPCNARRVVKFNPLDKSFTEIGPDLGWGVAKWVCGVLANTSNHIYCHLATPITSLKSIRSKAQWKHLG